MKTIETMWTKQKNSSWSCISKSFTKNAHLTRNWQLERCFCWQSSYKFIHTLDLHYLADRIRNHPHPSPFLWVKHIPKWSVYGAPPQPVEILRGLLVQSELSSTGSHLYGLESNGLWSKLVQRTMENYHLQETRTQSWLQLSILNSPQIWKVYVRLWCM